jgi:hypothetical protein
MSNGGILSWPKNMGALGNLFLAIELVQTGMTDLPMIAAACHLPLDTIEEIAAAHARNTEEIALCATTVIQHQKDEGQVHVSVCKRLSRLRRAAVPSPTSPPPT